MTRKTDLMLPIHVVVPASIREQIVKRAVTRGVSVGEITRDLLSIGLAKGLDEC